MARKTKQQNTQKRKTEGSSFSVKEGFVKKKNKKKRKAVKLENKKPVFKDELNPNSSLKQSENTILSSQESTNKSAKKKNKNKKKNTDAKPLATNQAENSQANEKDSDTPANKAKSKKHKKKKKVAQAPNTNADNASSVTQTDSKQEDKNDNVPKKKKVKRNKYENIVVEASKGVVDVTEEYMRSWDAVNEKTAQKTAERAAAAQKAKLAKGGKPQKANKKKEANDNKAATPIETKQPEEQEPKKSKPDRIDDREARLWQMNDDFNQTVRQLKEEKLPDMSAWRDLFVPAPVLHALAEDGFTSPTPIQTLTLPAAIRDRRDIVGAAETGSGKTLAFGIPLLHHVLRFKQEFGESAAEGNEEESGEEGEDESESGEEMASGDEEEEAEDQSEEIEMESENDESEVENDDAMDNETNDSEDATGNQDNSDNDSDNNSSDSSDDKEVETISKTEEEGRQKGGFVLSSDQVIETLEIPIGVDLGGVWQESVGSDDENANQSPDEEDEEMEENQDGMGCVRVLNNVVFDMASSSKTSDSDWRVDPSRPLLALILTPTRELAVQIKQHIDKAARHTSVQTCIVVGGMAVQKQMRMLKRRPEIVVATPGRLWELIQEGAPHLSSVENIKYLVIDEADRMVEKGHFQELSQLLQLINGNETAAAARQSLVFSATLTLVHAGPNRMVKTKKRRTFKQLTEKDKLDVLMTEVGVRPKAKVVDLSRREGTAESLVESRIGTSVEDKDLYIYYFLKQYPGRTLVFANSKDALRRLGSVLTLLQCKPLMLHADLRQKQRLKNLDRFKSDPRALLLATDVAARGLDIPDVQHVIHFQVPRTSENYVHRSGRTARANREGLSVMLVSAEDLPNYRKIIKTLNRNEELPMFPVEEELLPRLRERVSLARQVDKKQHAVDKKRQQNSWFEKAAEEADIELDHDNIYELVDDEGDTEQRAKNQAEVQAMKARLNSLLSLPAIQASVGSRYPTQSGKLELPKWTENPDAANSLKASLKQPAPQKSNSIDSDTKETAKQRKRKRRWERQKEKKQKLQNS